MDQLISFVKLFEANRQVVRKMVGSYDENSLGVKKSSLGNVEIDLFVWMNCTDC